MGVLTELYRRWLVARHKPRHWLLRPGTIDRRLFRTVAVENEYRLPRRLARTDLVLDVGAHVGSFAHAALKRGAGTVCCCEADPDNFRLLRHNLAPYRERVRLLSGAVWRSDRAVTRLPFGNPVDRRNTGAGRVAGRREQTVPALPFDELVEEVTDGSMRRVRLLKLDCEGSEWPILLTSRTLDRIDAICGEYHLGRFPELFHVNGCEDFWPALLDDFLGEQGFRVRIQPSPREPDRLGLFFADRRQRP